MIRRPQLSVLPFLFSWGLDSRSFRKTMNALLHMHCFLITFALLLPSVHLAQRRLGLDNVHLRDARVPGLVEGGAQRAGLPRDSATRARDLGTWGAVGDWARLGSSSSNVIRERKSTGGPCECEAPDRQCGEASKARDRPLASNAAGARPPHGVWACA